MIFKKHIHIPMVQKPKPKMLSSDRLTVELLWYDDAANWLTTPIKWLTKAQYSHIGLFVNGIYYESILPGIRRLEGKAATERRSEAMAHFLISLERDDVERAMVWADTNVGGRYDIAGLVINFIALLTGYRFILAGSGQYICSGLVAMFLMIAGSMDPDHDDPRLETPGSLAQDYPPQPLR